MQIKYQSLIQSKQGNVDVFEHSQAYYIIKAAQEREELERKDDEFKAKISKSEFEYKALLNTLDHLKGRNMKFRELQLNKNATEGDFDLRKNLQEQFHAIGSQLVERKNEYEGLKAIYESNQHYYKELLSRCEILKNSKKEKQIIVSNMRVEEHEQLEKIDRANKACTKNEALLQKKMLVIEKNSFEIVVFQQTILENLLKTLNSLIL